VVDSVIDGFGSSSSADLVREFAFPFPLQVLARLLDLAEESISTFHRLAVDLICVPVNRRRGVRASAAMASLLHPLSDARRKDPGEDVNSLMACATGEAARPYDVA